MSLGPHNAGPLAARMCSVALPGDELVAAVAALFVTHEAPGLTRSWKVLTTVTAPHSKFRAAGGQAVLHQSRLGSDTPQASRAPVYPQRAERSAKGVGAVVILEELLACDDGEGGFHAW